MRIPKNNVTQDLVKEFIEKYKDSDLPDPEVYPQQLWYKYQLFLLEKGIYGIQPVIEPEPRSESEETTPECENTEVPD